LGFFAAFGMMITTQSSWEATIGGFGSGLVNGGSVALVYGTIVAVLGSTALAASLGEMASM
jgi:choline transport protein